MLNNWERTRGTLWVLYSSCYKASERNHDCLVYILFFLIMFYWGGHVQRCEKKAYHPLCYYSKANVYDERWRTRMRDDIICMYIYVSWFPPQYPFLSIVILIIRKKKIERKREEKRTFASNTISNRVDKFFPYIWS